MYTESKRFAAAAANISKILMWWWPWCVPIQKPKPGKLPHVLHNSWQLPVLIDGVCLTESSWTRQKSWTCSYCVSSMRNRNCSKTLGFVTFWWDALCATTLEAHPSPIQMLGYHATSRRWFMLIARPGQRTLMGDRLAILHSGSDLPVSS